MKRFRYSACAGLTWTELLVTIVLLVVAFTYLNSNPAHWGTVDRNKVQAIQMLNNMRELHRANQVMAMDGTTTGKTNLAWPGDHDVSFANWASNLVSEGYLATNDLTKLLSAPGKVTTPGQLPRANTNAVLVYAVKDTSSGDTVFLSSANLTNTPQGWSTNTASPLFAGRYATSPPNLAARYAVYLRKDGSGEVIRTSTNAPLSRVHIVGVPPTNTAGSYVPLLR